MNTVNTTTITAKEIVQDVPHFYPMLSSFEVITLESETWKEISSVLNDAQDRLDTLIDDGAIRPVLDGEKFFSIEEVCNMLGCGLKTINRIIQEGELEVLTLGKGGRKRIVKESALMKLLDKRAQFKGHKDI